MSRNEPCQPGLSARDPQRGAQLARVGAGQVQQRVGVGHRQRFWPGGDLDDRVAGLDASLGEDPQVEAGPVVGDQQRGQLRLAHPHAHPVAGHPRLGDLELRLADPVPVTDAHLVVGQPVDGQVLPEHPVHEVVAPEVLLPVPVRIELVDEHRPLLTAVPGQIPLPVSVDIQPPHHHRPGHRLLPDPGVHRLALPGDVFRQADVDGHDDRHGDGHRSGGVSGQRLSRLTTIPSWLLRAITTTASSEPGFSSRCGTYGGTKM